MKSILSILSVFIFISCSSDDSSNNSETTNNEKLIKIVETNYFENSVNTTNFTYIDNMIVKSEVTKSNGDIFKTEFIYENNKLTKLKYFDNNFPLSEVVFGYNGNLITSSSGIEDGITYVHLYEYNSAGNLIKDSQYDNEFLSTVSLYTHDNSGNILSKTLNSSSEEITYEYDTKKNPFTLVYNAATLKRLGVGYTENNLLRGYSMNFNQTIYEYIYNSNNYPVEQTIKYDGYVYSKTVFTYN